jgi:hypothetical protein
MYLAKGCGAVLRLIQPLLNFCGDFRPLPRSLQAPGPVTAASQGIIVGNYIVIEHSAGHKPIGRRQRSAQRKATLVNLRVLLHQLQLLAVHPWKTHHIGFFGLAILLLEITCRNNSDASAIALAGMIAALSATRIDLLEVLRS